MANWTIYEYLQMTIDCFQMITIVLTMLNDDNTRLTLVDGGQYDVYLTLLINCWNHLKKIILKCQLIKFTMLIH